MRNKIAIVEKKLLDVFYDFGIYIYDENDKTERLNMDSLTYISLIVTLEEKMNFKFEPEDIVGVQLKTFNDFLRLVCKKGGIDY